MNDPKTTSGQASPRTSRRKDYTKEEAKELLKNRPPRFPKSVCFDINELVQIAKNNNSSTITFFFGTYDQDDVEGYNGHRMKGQPVLLVKERKAELQQGKSGSATQDYRYVDNGSLCPPLYNCEESAEQAS